MYVFSFLLVLRQQKKINSVLSSFVVVCKCECVCMVRMCSCVYIFAIVLQGFKALRSLLVQHALWFVKKKNVTIAASLEGFMFDYKLGCAARKMMLITNKRKN